MKALNTALLSRLQGTAISSLLAGGTAGTSIFALQAPESAARPYIVYNIQGGGDENLTANRTKNLVVFIRAYAGTNATAGSIDAQIDSALHFKPLTVSGWTNNMWMARETDLETVENPPTGGQVFMNGALYRIRLT
jgi:hypothetical protein